MSADYISYSNDNAMPGDSLHVHMNIASKGANSFDAIVIGRHQWWMGGEGTFVKRPETLVLEQGRNIEHIKTIPP